MISLVNGVVRSISLDKVMVEVGGVGLSLAVTQKTSAQLNIGVQAQLFTTLVVREDALTLYGFLEDGDPLPSCAGDGAVSSVVAPPGAPPHSSS
jgi:Holliday junction DNA helicase RuvA